MTATIMLLLSRGTGKITLAAALVRPDTPAILVAPRPLARLPTTAADRLAMFQVMLRQVAHVHVMLAKAVLTAAQT
jgi:hypothetical protein